MPKRTIEKIIRYAGSPTVNGFSCNQKTGELTYFLPEGEKNLLIPNQIKQDFFRAVERWLSQPSNNQNKHLSCQLPQGRASINLTLIKEDGNKKIIAEISHQETCTTFNQLGLLFKQKKIVKRGIKSSRGLIVVATPAGSGLSDVVYSFTTELEYGRHSASLFSAQPEFPTPGVSQVILRPPFAKNLIDHLERASQQNLDIAIVPEIKEKKEAQALINFSYQGRLAIVGCRSKDTFSTLLSFLKVGPLPQDAITALSLIIAERKVKRLCPHCLQNRLTTKEDVMVLSKKFSLRHKTAEGLLPKITAQSLGCAKCHYRGTVGEIGLFEILPINKEIRNCFAFSGKKITDNQLLTALRESRKIAGSQGFAPFLFNALELAKNKIVSLAEIFKLSL